MRRSPLLAILLGFAVQLVGQSYQSSFSEVRFDRGNSPRIHHGDLAVEAATGSVSFDLPLGPGIGARGAKFTPTVRARWAPQARTNTCARIVEHPGDIPRLEYWLSGPWISFNAETRGVLRPTATWGNQGGIGFPDGRQTGFNWMRATTAPISDGDAENLIHTFLGTARYLWKNPDANRTSCLRVTQLGDLVIPLADNGIGIGLSIPFSTQNDGSPCPPGVMSHPIEYREIPESILVIPAKGGEAAYWYSRHKTTYQMKSPMHPVMNTIPDFQKFDYFEFQNAIYTLDRIIGRYGDTIQFTTIPDPQNSQQSYQATWILEGATRAVVQVQLAATGWSITYPESAPQIFFTLATEPVDISIPRAPLGDAPDELTIDVGGNVRSERISGLELGALTQLTLPTSDQIRWNYRGSSGPFGGQGPRLLDSVVFPGKTVTLAWGYHLFRSLADGEILSTFGVEPNWFWGATAISEQDTITNISKLTTYNRNIPQPKFATTEPNYYGQYDAWAWETFDFKVTITLPDGTQRIQTYSQPISDNQFGDEGQIRFLAFQKHQLLDELILSPQGVIYQRILNDRFDVRRVFNGNGDLNKSSHIYPTRVQSIDFDFNTMMIEEEYGWDDLQCGWTRHGHAVRAATMPEPFDWPSLARRGQAIANYGTVAALRTTSREFNNDFSKWLFHRVASERTTREQDSTNSLPARLGTESYVSRTFLPGFNSITNQSHGDSPQVSLAFTLGSSGLSAANPSQVTLNSQGLTFSGAAGAGYQYDSFGYLERISPFGANWNLQQAQDAFGRPVSQKDSNGLVKTFSRDTLGRLISIRPDTPEVPISIAYPSLFAANVTREAQSETYRYDGFGNLIGTDRPGGSKSFHYDLNGRLTFESIWGSATVGTSFEYDYRGREKRITDPDGLVKAISYDGLTKTVTVGGYSTVYIYDVLNRLARVVDPKGYQTDYWYDCRDRLIEMRQTGGGLSQTRSWTYNDLGWLTSLTQPESGTTTYSNFTVLGKPQRTDYNGRVVDTSYDALGRVTGVTAADGSVAQTFAWDGGAPFNGKLRFSTDRGVQLDYGYSGLNGRLDSLSTTILDPIGGAAVPAFTQSFGYDPYGHRTSATLPSGRQIGYTWDDSRDVLSGVSSPPGRPGSWGTVVAMATVTSFNPADLPFGITFANGASTDFTYSPDQARLAAMAHAKTGVNAFSKTWTYDWNDPRHLLRGDGEDSYDYDELGRLKTATFKPLGSPTAVTQSFAYDPFGNQTSSTFPSGVPVHLQRNLVGWTMNGGEIGQMALTNRLPGSAGGVATGALYDDQGNLTRINKQPGDTSAFVSLRYDALGRVTTMVDQERGITEKYAYTPEGLRTRIDTYQGVTEGSLVLTKVQVKLYNDQRQLVSEFETAATPAPSARAKTVGAAAAQVR